MKHKQIVLACCLGGAGLLACSAAQAACTVGKQLTVTVNGASGLPIVVKQNARPGDLLKEYSHVVGTEGGWANCVGPDRITRRMNGTLVPSGIPDVYTTTLAGVGVKVEYQSSTGGARRAYPYSIDYSTPGSYTLRDEGTYYVSYYRIAGDFAGGSIGSGAPFQAAQAALDSAASRPINFLEAVDVQFNLATCDITSGSINQTVDLGQAAPHSFTGGGTPWRDFKLVSENCDLTQFHNVTFSFNGNAEPTDPTLFAVTGPGGGVGVQLQTAAGTDIDPGGDATMPTLAAGGEYAFRARFRRLAGDLVNGPVSTDVIVKAEYD
ncbi:fimbrial protein [Stenotrophomonas rhizophila]|uniref:fimbrial protein n=1 Tax=Stenotrophomonas rhizophila TaxID=216778 RepID=UPI001E3D583F|nr:fimbrial protein [Stenotrophomonas rhizophila]MCC7634558.1 type 1 fimbrial protein [Stenotrophomonas rhizophila]MCC7664173.1 type 1 fimbrial protein [Stenotrophomonas rhizophila]